MPSVRQLPNILKSSPLLQLSGAKTEATPALANGTTERLKAVPSKPPRTYSRNAPSPPKWETWRKTNRTPHFVRCAYCTIRGRLTQATTHSRKLQSRLIVCAVRFETVSRASSEKTELSPWNQNATLRTVQENNVSPPETYARTDQHFCPTPALYTVTNPGTGCHSETHPITPIAHQHDTRNIRTLRVLCLDMLRNSGGFPGVGERVCDDIPLPRYD